MWESILGIIKGLFESIPIIANLFKKPTVDRVDDERDAIDDLEDQARRRKPKK